MPTSTVKYFVNGIERPGSYDLQGNDVVYAVERVEDSAGNVREFTTNTRTVAFSGTPAGFTAMQDLNGDFGLSYWWDNPAINFYLPNYGVGPLSIGDPTRVIRSTTDKSITLTAGEGPATADGKTWRTGAMMLRRPQIAGIGSFGAIVHAFQPNAVCAIFGYARVTNSSGQVIREKETDFELTKYETYGWNPNFWLYNSSGQRVRPNSSRPKARLPWYDRPQKLVARQLTNPSRVEFWGDDVLYETLTPADYPAGTIWDTITPMDTFFSVEKHLGPNYFNWAGHQQSDYDKGAAMRVHAAFTGAST